MIRPFLSALALLAAASLAPAAAQAPKVREQSAAPGKQVRVLAVTNLKKDCSQGPLPEIKVTATPRNGAFVQRVNKMKTPASYRCPNAEANVQLVFYEGKAGFSGADEMTVEIKAADGSVTTQTIKITVGGAGAAKKESGTDL